VLDIPAMKSEMLSFERSTWDAFIMLDSCLPPPLDYFPP
jgi:hypothetical protein